MDLTPDEIAGISTFGTVMVFIMLSAQLPAMYTVVMKTKSVANLSCAPTIGQMSNFATWTIYAIFKGDPNILRVNVLGIAVASCYLAVFFRYAVGQNRVTLFRLLGALLAGGSALEAGLSVGLHGDLRVTLLGAVAVGCNVVMYAAPIAQIRMALSCMNPSALPMLLCCANAITSGTWMIYGIAVSNWFVAGPNVAGLALNVLQLVLGLYINVRARMDPSIVKPLPGEGGKGEEEEDGDSDGKGLLASMREEGEGQDMEAGLNAVTTGVQPRYK